MTITETRPETDVPVAAPAGADSLVTTADHKLLGLLFLGGAALFLLAGAVVGMVLRLELVDEGVAIVGGNYNRLFSFHASVSALLFLPAAWVGLATYIVPLQIGAGRLALPRLHAFAAWMYVLGGVLLISAYVMGPPVGLGIADAIPAPSPPGGADNPNALAIVAMGMVAVAMVLAAVDLAVTILKLRTPGLTLRRLPMFSWGSLVASLVTIFATPVFLGGLVLLYLDQRIGGTFFGGDNVAGQAVWQHTLWLFGRPEVYLLALPGLAAACDIVATHARRPLLSLDAARLHLGLFGLLSFGAWAAGSQVSDAIVLPTFTPLTALVAVPMALLSLVWLGTLVKANGKVRLHPSLLFVIGAVLLFATAGLHVLIAAAAGVEGTAWTTGHLHTAVIGAPTLLLAGAVYHWAPKLFGRELSEPMGKLAALGLFGGFFLMGLGSYLLGYDGAPAHVKDFTFSSSASTYALLSVIGAVIVVAAALVVVAEAVMAAAGRSVTAGPDDPYQGLTLEWATASPPSRAGFDSVPEVRSAHPLLDLHTSAEASNG